MIDDFLTDKPQDWPQNTGLDIGGLCKEFLAVNDNAKAWGGEPEEFGEASDCDRVSTEFVDFLERRGLEGVLVHLDTESPIDNAMGYHCIVEFGGLWIDWTARQFHNVGTTAAYRLDYSEIACPLIWVAGGPYPLPDVLITHHSYDVKEVLA